MEKNRDSRRTNVSTVNDLPRRRQRIATLRDSTDQDRQMDLQETVRLGDREQLHRKDREFPKRRRVDRPMVQQRSDDAETNRGNESMEDSSDEEYYEEEEDTRINRNRMNQLSPTSSSLSNSRRGLRTFRSSPVLRAAADEMFGVPIPRRARSSSTKRLHEYCNGSGALAEDLSHRRFSPSASLIGSGSASPSSSGASMKKKTKFVDRRTPSFGVASNSRPATIQDDIEIEVAEALFDLMKQSQSQFQSSQRQENVGRDGKNNASDEIKMSKADGGKDENNTFSVHHEPSIKVNAETVSSDSLKELRREGRIEKEREKFPDDPAQELVNGDGFVKKVKVGPPIEIESPSCVKVNACDIQDPTRTKAHYEAIIAEAKREAKLEIDLMALPQSRERDASVELGTDTEIMTQVVQKKSESISKDGRLIGMQEENIGVTDSSQLQMEKNRHSDFLNVSNSATQGRKEQKNQSPTSLLPFPIGMSSWPGVLPPTGYMPPLQAILPSNGSAKSSMITQPPQFKFSQRRAKRCATHQFVAHNINNHQELVKKCLSSSSNGSATLYGTKSANTKYMLPSAQNFIGGHPLLGDFQVGQNLVTVSAESVKDKISDVAVSFDANATTNGKSVLQQAPHQAAASSFLRGSGFIFPFGPHQTTMMAQANSPGPPQSPSSAGITSLPSNPGGRHSVLPSASAAMSLNHPLFPSNEAYMAMLQNSGCPIPMPSFKGGTPSLPYFNPSLYHSPMFNVTQNQQQQHLAIPQTTNSSSHKQPHSQQSEKPPHLSHISSSKSETEISRKSGASVAHGLSQPMDLSIGNKTMDRPQQQGRVELVPQAFASSFGSTASTSPAPNLSSMAQTFHMLPDMSWMGSNQMVQQKNFDGKSLSSSSSSGGHGQSFNKEISVGPPKFDGLPRSMNFLPSSLTGNQHHHHQQQQFIQVQNSQLQQLSGSAQVKSSGPNGSFLTSIFPSNSHPVFTIPNDNSSSVMKSSHGQSHFNIVMKNEAPSSRNKQRSASSTGTAAAAGQEAEAGSSQKTSPACRRNVPSILSMCPSPLPELKY